MSPIANLGDFIMLSSLKNIATLGSIVFLIFRYTYLMLQLTCTDDYHNICYPDSQLYVESLISLMECVHVWGPLQY